MLEEEAFNKKIIRNLPLEIQLELNKREQEDKLKTLDQGLSKLLILGASLARTKVSLQPIQKHSLWKVTQMFSQVKPKVAFQVKV